MTPRPIPAAVIAILLAAIPAAAPAQSTTITGGAINIGIDNITGGYGVMIGDSNQNTAPSGFYWPVYGHCALYLGSFNQGAADRSLLVGSYNSTTYEETLDGYPVESLVIGSFNWLSGDRCAIVGRNNSIARIYLGLPGSEEWRKPQNTLVVGTGLLGRNDNSLIVGRFNQAVTDPFMPPAGPQPLLVVGNGSAEARSNALVVLDNGDIIIPKAQGDISMGIYGD
jgi:hypothetical protein